MPRKPAPSASAAAVAKAIAQVPPPDNSDPITSVIAARFKDRLMRLVIEGMPCFDKMTGQPVLIDGTHVHRPPSAAELSVIERFLARAQAAGAINDHDEVQKVINEAKARGWKLPELDNGDDEATA